jgi:hypothetical protein
MIHNLDILIPTKLCCYKDGLIASLFLAQLTPFFRVDIENEERLTDIVINNG